MSPPKHLWTGDWERESAAAAEALANRSPLPVRAPADEPPPHLPRTARSEPPPPRSEPRPRAPRRKRTRRRNPIRPRVALLGAFILLLLAGGAYGITNMHHSRRSTTGGRSAWLGAKLSSWPAGGALVSSVASGGPAASAGLKPGDVIIQVQGRPVSAPVSVSSAVAALSPGNRLQIVAVRGSRTFTTSAALGGHPPDAP